MSLGTINYPIILDGPNSGISAYYPIVVDTLTLHEITMYITPYINQHSNTLVEFYVNKYIRQNPDYYNWAIYEVIIYKNHIINNVNNRINIRRKHRILLKIICKIYFIELYQEVLHKRYSPGGDGYLIAKDDFNTLAQLL